MILSLRKQEPIQAKAKSQNEKEMYLIITENIYKFAPLHHKRENFNHSMPTHA